MRSSMGCSDEDVAPTAAAVSAPKVVAMKGNPGQRCVAAIVNAQRRRGAREVGNSGNASKCKNVGKRPTDTGW